MDPSTDASGDPSSNDVWTDVATETLAFVCVQIDKKKHDDVFNFVFVAPKSHSLKQLQVFFAPGVTQALTSDITRCECAFYHVGASR